MCPKPSNVHPWYLRSDQGTEYTNRNLTKYYKIAGGAIQHFTVRYTPQKLEYMFERAGKTPIMGMTRCFLLKHIYQNASEVN